MQDNFKSFAEGSSKEFEFPFDAEKGWSDFQSRQPKTKNKFVWMVAAGLTLLISAGLVFTNLDTESSEEISEWQEIENFYQGQIDEMTTLVSNLSDDEEILFDLEEMDQAFAEIKKDLKDDAANAEVIEAMMDHYRLKLSILEKMLEEIRDNDEQKDISRI